MRTLLIGFLLTLPISSSAGASTCVNTRVSTDIAVPTNGCQEFQPGWLGTSGYDSLDPPSESWPLRFIIGPNNAVIFNGELFPQGSQVVFDYDAQRKALTFNGMVFLIDAPPMLGMLPREPPSQRGQWCSDLRQRVLLDDSGTLEQKVERAMVALGTDLIDSTFALQFLGSNVMIKFKDYAFPETIILEPERPITPIKDHSKFFWNLALIHYRQLVQEEDPYLWVEGHGSASYLGGTRAARALELINAVIAGRQLSKPEAAALADMPQLIKDFIASNLTKSGKIK